MELNQGINIIDDTRSFYLFTMRHRLLAQQSAIIVLLTGAGLLPSPKLVIS